jgi:hypothetical protein
MNWIRFRGEQIVIHNDVSPREHALKPFGDDRIQRI